MKIIRVIKRFKVSLQVTRATRSIPLNLNFLLMAALTEEQAIMFCCRPYFLLFHSTPISEVSRPISTELSHMLGTWKFWEIE